MPEAFPNPTLFRSRDSRSPVLHGYARLRVIYFQVYFDWLIVSTYRYEVIDRQFLLEGSLSSEFLLVCDSFSHNLDQVAPYQGELELVCLDARGFQQISYQSHFCAHLSLSPGQQVLKFCEQIAGIGRLGGFEYALEKTTSLL